MEQSTKGNVYTTNDNNNSNTAYYYSSLLLLLPSLKQEEAKKKKSAVLQSMFWKAPFSVDNSSTNHVLALSFLLLFVFHATIADPFIS